MSSKLPIAYIEIRTFAHATEDTDKVIKAVHNMIPPELVETITLSKTDLSGHHGNPITLIEAKIKDRNTAQQVFQKLSNSLSIMDKETLTGKIQCHLERGNLYVRIDKQSAYLGVAKLGESDTIHLKIHFKKHTLEEIAKTCREFGLIS